MTAGQLSFHPEAIDEAEAAAQWYRERSPQAAAQFVAPCQPGVHALRFVTAIRWRDRVPDA